MVVEGIGGIFENLIWNLKKYSSTLTYKACLQIIEELEILSSPQFNLFNAQLFDCNSQEKVPALHHFKSALYHSIPYQKCT